MPPTEIGKEMLDEIISPDPRVTQGIGGDNMTIMIIDLQPLTRKWRSEAVAKSLTPESLATLKADQVDDVEAQPE